MKLALAIFLVAVAASASAANVTRCVIGERVTFNGSVVLDNAVMGPCADPSAECVKFTYNQVSEQTGKFPDVRGGSLANCHFGYGRVCAGEAIEQKGRV